MDALRELVAALARRAAREPDVIFRERDYTQPHPAVVGGRARVLRDMAAEAGRRAAR